MGRTEIVPLMGGGLKHILSTIQQAVANLTAQGRHPTRHLRVIVCWQFNEFFHQNGPMKNRFPLEIQDDIKSLIEVLNGLHSVAILGARSHIWEAPSVYDDWSNVVRTSFENAAVPWVDGTYIFGKHTKAKDGWHLQNDPKVRLSLGYSFCCLLNAQEFMTAASSAASSGSLPGTQHLGTRFLSHARGRTLSRRAAVPAARCRLRRRRPLQQQRFHSKAHGLPPQTILGLMAHQQIRCGRSFVSNRRKLSAESTRRKLQLRQIFSAFSSWNKRNWTG